MMEDLLAVMREVDVRKINSDIIWANFQLTDNPCILYDVLLTPVPSAVGKIRVYDGSIDSGHLRALIASATDESKQVRFIPPMYCSRGLSVEFVTNVDNVTIRYLVC